PTITISLLPLCSSNPPSTTHIYTLSLHDALPISKPSSARLQSRARAALARPMVQGASFAARARHISRRYATTVLWRPKFQAFKQDRKSTRLNSSHRTISYAVFCLKKKKKKKKENKKKKKKNKKKNKKI